MDSIQFTPGVLILIMQYRTRQNTKYKPAGYPTLLFKNPRQQEKESELRRTTRGGGRRGSKNNSERYTTGDDDSDDERLWKEW